MDIVDEIFTDPKLKAVLTVYWGYLGLPPGRLSFAYLALLFWAYIEFKAYHVKGGSQAMSEAIFNKFLSYGGSARFNTGASAIKVENGRVQAVVTDDGDEISCNYVVSNISTIQTYLGLIGRDKAPEEALYEMRGRNISTSAYTLYVGFDAEPRDLGITESTNFLLSSLDVSDGILERMRRPEITDELLVLSCYDVADPEFSPPGTCQANIVTLKYGEPWLRIPPTQYQNTKMKIAENMLRRVEEIFPGCRSHIEEVEAASPLTHMRYLGHPYGAVYGFEHYPKDTMLFAPGRRSPIKGLYFASGWAGDAGFQPTLEAGKTAAGSIIKDMGK